MSQGDYPVELVLESTESAMVPRKQPKALLFDIGGVCVSRSSSILLEPLRGKISNALEHIRVKNHRHSDLQDKSIPSTLLFDFDTIRLQLLIGFQVVSPFQAILDYEIANGIPPGWVNYSISKSAPKGSWHKLERGEILMDAEFFKCFNLDLRDQQRWKDFYVQTMKKRGLSVEAVPPVPEVDGEWMFFDMMRISRTPDPWMWPALQKLKASGRFLLGALSNTVVFPPDHPYSQSSPDDPREIFDVFISSAHVGLRKPDPRIYGLALKELNRFALEHAATRGRHLGWADSIEPDEIVFLDDIGENLKAARKAGFGTVKVNLGMAYDAVTHLEELTGMELAGDHPKISSAPKIPKARL
jgi:FMN phosphatase YigB (HAD superfamily)